MGIEVGGAGMATIIARYDIATAVVIQALIVVSVLLLVIAWRERAGEKRFPWSAGGVQRPGASRNFGFTITLKELKRALSNRTTATGVLLAVSFLICEGIYDPLTTEFFVQDLGWGAARFYQAQGIWGVMGELWGALLGGYLCDRFGRRRIAALGMVMTMVSLVLFGFTASAWFEPGYPQVLLLPAFKGWLAFTTVSLFSLYMKMSWTQAAATQFTVYMATNNLGYALGARLLTWLESMDYGLNTADYYLLAGIALIIPIGLLTQLDPNGVERNKRAENEALALTAA